MIKKYKIELLCIISIAFIVRAFIFIGYLSDKNRYWQVDSGTYHHVATSLATGKGLSNPDGTDHFYRVPGYPFFLSLFYRIIGIDTKNVLWPQIIIASLIPALIFLLSITLFPESYAVALLSAIWSVIHLGFVLYSGFFMTESLFIFFLLLFFILFLPTIRSSSITEKKDFPLLASYYTYLFDPLPEALGVYHFIKDKEAKQQILSYTTIKYSSHQEEAIVNCLWAGMLLGCAALIRPVGHYLLILSVIMLFLFRPSWSDKISTSFSLTLGWLLTASWWLIRNYALLGHFFFHTLPGGHFLYLSAARVAMVPYQCTYQEARKKLHAEADQLMYEKREELKRPLSPIEACLINEELAKKYFLNNPFISLKLWATDIFRTMFSLYSAEILYLENNRKEIAYFDKRHGLCRMIMRYLFPETDSWKLKILVYLEIFLFFIVLLGFVGALAKGLLCSHFINLREKLLNCIPFMALFIIISLAGGYARMRLPIEPFLIIFSSWSWIQNTKTITKQIKRKLQKKA